VTLNCHTQKMMQRAKIFHGEFLLQGCNHTVKKLLRRGCEDNVVHVQQQVNHLSIMVKDK